MTNHEIMMVSVILRLDCISLAALGRREPWAITANRSYLTNILQEHPEIRVDLAQRARGLFPYTMEAFAYLMASEAIAVDRDGGIAVQEGQVKKSITGSQDTKDCQTVARALGLKLARINDRATIYSTLGIRP